MQGGGEGGVKIRQMGFENHKHVSYQHIHQYHYHYNTRPAEYLILRELEFNQTPKTVEWN